MHLKPSLAAVAIFGCGFALAWLVKPAPTVGRVESAPPQTREDRSDRPPLATKPAAAALQRLQAAGYNREEREAVLASLSPEEFPALLAEFKECVGIYELNYEEKDLFDELVKAWYAKAPETALAWLHNLPKPDDQERALGAIVDGLVATDLDAALALLRQQGSYVCGHVTIPDILLEKAPAHGANTLMEICRLGLNPGSCTVGLSLTYPDDFDFKRVLDGLAEAKAAFGKDAGFSLLPTNLVGEWTQRDPQAAWAWLQQGEIIVFNGTKEFFEAYASTEVGTAKDLGVMLASTFEPTADPDRCYDNVWAALGARPSPELLESFLQAAPGERATILDGLFDHSWSWLGKDIEQVHVWALLLDTMTPAQRLETLRRNDVYLLTEEQQRPFIPVLRRLGHSEEEIHTLWPSRKQ